MTTRALANPRRTTLAELRAHCQAAPGCRNLADRVVESPDGPRPSCPRCASAQAA